jgi:hypothetical protein
MVRRLLFQRFHHLPERIQFIHDLVLDTERGEGDLRFIDIIISIIDAKNGVFQ